MSKRLRLKDDEFALVEDYRRRRSLGAPEFKEDGNTGTLRGTASSLDELIEKVGLDMDYWEVSGLKIKDNVYQVTMQDREQDLDFEKDPEGKQVMTGHAKRKGQVTHNNQQFYIEASFKKRTDYAAPLIKKLVKEIPKFKFTHYRPKHNKGTGIALEVAPLDAHFGKLSHFYETGYRDYDLNLSFEDFTYSIDKILSWSSHEKLEKIFYIIGQDIFHTDNVNGKTSQGDHHMDVDGRIFMIYSRAFEIIVKSIYKALSVAPVEIIWSPGNHDSFTSMALCHALDQHFIKNKFVTVDVTETPGPISRKARLWGNLLVGWTHRIKGRENSWGNELALAFPKLWGDSTFREWHCGDQHLKKSTKLTPEFTQGGVLIRQLTALSPVDKWHFDNLFTDAVPGGEAFLWSKDHGVYSNLTAWIGPYQAYRNKIISL